MGFCGEGRGYGKPASTALMRKLRQPNVMIYPSSVVDICVVFIAQGIFGPCRRANTRLSPRSFLRKAMQVNARVGFPMSICLQPGCDAVRRPLRKLGEKTAIQGLDSLQYVC